MIDRTGVSRFPIKEAREGLRIAEDLRAEAHAELEDDVVVKVESVD